MAQTLAEAVSSLSSTCVSRADRLKSIRALLNATEEGMFKSAIGGGVQRYKVNTGQTVIEVEAESTTETRKLWHDLNAMYNELRGLVNGTSVMIMRDANTIRR